MNCGGSHETNCSEVLAEVWLFLDQECDQTRRALLAKHLDECEPCLAEYGIDEKLKALLASKCGGEHAPGRAARPAAPPDPPRRAGTGRGHDGAGGREARRSRSARRASSAAAEQVRTRTAREPVPNSGDRLSSSPAWRQLLGRLPWFAPFFLRSRFLRPRLDMDPPHSNSSRNGSSLPRGWMDASPVGGPQDGTVTGVDAE